MITHFYPKFVNANFIIRFYDFSMQCYSSRKITFISGQGLGANESGMAEAIKVVLKNDTAGVSDFT